MKETNGTPTTKSPKPDNMSVLEWHQNNVKKGIIDALADLGDIASDLSGSENTGNMEAVIDRIDERIWQDTITSSEAQNTYDHKGVEGVFERVSSMIENHKELEYVQRYLHEEGRVTGYLNTLRMVRQLSEMMGD